MLIEILKWCFVFPAIWCAAGGLAWVIYQVGPTAEDSAPRYVVDHIYDRAEARIALLWATYYTGIAHYDRTRICTGLLRLGITLVAPVLTPLGFIEIAICALLRRIRPTTPTALLA